MRLFSVSVLLIAIASGAAAQAPAPNPPAPAPAAQLTPSQIKSPEVLPDNRVTFRLSAPKAASVSVRGDFPSGFEPGNLPLTKGDDGVWSITVGPLKPEMYSYSFTVDGVSVADPGNPHRNFFLVPGPLSDLYAVQDVPHGTVASIWYPSPHLKLAQRRLIVYTPPGYEASNTRYPVLYLLHGGGQDEETWTNSGHAPQILDNLIASGKAKPMIVVMPNGNIIQTASRSYLTQDQPMAGYENMPFADSMATDLIPFIDKTYRTLPNRYDRAIAGLSMGGGQTIYTAFTHPELYGWVELMSGATHGVPGTQIVIPPPPNAADLREPGITQNVDLDKFFAALPNLNPTVAGQFRLFESTIGEHDGLQTEFRTVTGAMKARGIPVTAVSVPGYIHEFAFWRYALADLAQKLFQTAK